jgi:hypothetical protein
MFDSLKDMKPEDTSDWVMIFTMLAGAVSLGIWIIIVAWAWWHVFT